MTDGKAVESVRVSVLGYETVLVAIRSANETDRESGRLDNESELPS